MEQFTRVDCVDGSGEDRHTKLDAHVLVRSGEEAPVSVKYDERAKQASYLAEIAGIAAQCTREPGAATATLNCFQTAFCPTCLFRLRIGSKMRR